MALTQDQMIAREGKLTASRVAALMGGDKEEILSLWRELCGDPQLVAPDLDDVWPVQLGATTEKLNLDWYERKNARVLTRRGEVVVHPDYPWAAATLDGFDPILNAPVETKHVGGFEKFDVIVQRYMPQMHWQMECTKTTSCILSAIEGARQPRTEVISFNKEYADEMMSRAHKFMVHVWNMTPPVILDPVAAPVPVSAMREYNMTGSNEFASFASNWLQHKTAAKLFDEAVSGLKEITPNDAKRAYGYGISIDRNKAGSLRIKPL